MPAAEPWLARWMLVASALAERGRGRTAPNPNVGCVLVRDGRVVGRGWTQPGGRPHAEAMALAQAGAQAHGAIAYVTLEPCAHQSARGPCCTDALIAAEVKAVVYGVADPDPRTSGQGAARLASAGVMVNHAPEGLAEPCRRVMAGFLSRMTLGRPQVTLKLATSLDGRIARPDGESRWITGPRARAAVHLERARADAILVGAGTLKTDLPRLDVRLEGLEQRAPRRLVLTRTGTAPDGWVALPGPNAVFDLVGCNDMLVEGGASTAAAFLREDLVDRLILHRAPILIGSGVASLGDIGLTRLADAHGRWRLVERWALGSDCVEQYERVRCLPA